MPLLNRLKKYTIQLIVRHKNRGQKTAYIQSTSLESSPWQGHEHVICSRTILNEPLV